MLFVGVTAVVSILVVWLGYPLAIRVLGAFRHAAEIDRSADLPSVSVLLPRLSFAGAVSRASFHQKAAWVAAPSFGLFLPILLPLPLCPFRRRCSRLLLSSGEIGLAALCVAAGFSSCAGKPSRFPGCLPLRQNLPLSQTRPC